MSENFKFVKGITMWLHADSLDQRGRFVVRDGGNLLVESKAEGEIWVLVEKDGLFWAYKKVVFQPNDVRH